MHELMERLFAHPSTADGGFILVGPEVVFVCTDVKERSVVESRPVEATESRYPGDRYALDVRFEVEER